MTVGLDGQGRLVLSYAEGARPYRGNTNDTVMWIALRQCDGDCVAAARTLAGVWEVDEANALADLELWVGEMCARGLLEEDDGTPGGGIPRQRR